MTARLHAGTSSWSEKSWVGTFYPEGMQPGRFLSHYATQFDTVEADVTYYRIPDRKLVDGWNDKTPDGFLLAAKFPRSIVHAGDGPKPDPGRLLVYEVGSGWEPLCAFLGVPVPDEPFPRSNATAEFQERARSKD